MMHPTPEPVHFPSGTGRCAGDLYLPSDRAFPGVPRPPVVILAPGIGAERTFGLGRFAERFVERGLAALVFDYRHFGGSSGEPRHLVSPARQIADYRAAMAFVRSDPRVDGARIGLWGTSFSGGHVLVAASERPEGVRAVVSQIPFVSGIASTLVYPLRYHAPAVLLGILDALGGRLGFRPLTVPVVREKGFALLASPDSHAGYRALLPEGTDWSGRLPARVFLEILRYHPARSARRIRIPTLVLVALEDAICPPPATTRVTRRIPGARLEALPVGHFDPYRGESFERVVEIEADFLAEHLLG